MERSYTRLDRIITAMDDALRLSTGSAPDPLRPSPAGDIESFELNESERKHVAGLMRVNHAGEIAAQGLYQGHAAVARDLATEQQMQKAANEEFDHLAWCEQRLAELNESPSRLSPLWYAGAFAIGAEEF